MQRELAALGTPVFVKPARLGSSVGIAKVWSEAELGPALDAAFAHDSLVIVEGFSAGIEVECSVLGNGEPEGSVPGEIVLTGSDWYDYEAKYTAGGMELVVPARLPDAVLDEVRRLACDTFLRVGCAGLARVDFFVEDGERVLVNELNTLPGLHRHERLPEALGGVRRCPSRTSATACSRSRSSASRPSAPSRSKVPKGALGFRRRLPGRGGSRRSRRGRRPGASFVIQTR